jgi:hypothetical protein
VLLLLCRCEGCKQLVPAVKQMTIYDDPNVLVIHLKRFDGIFGGKVSRSIDFGMTLDLEPFICSKRRCRASSSNGSKAGGSSSLCSNGSAASGARLNGCGNGVASNGCSSSSCCSQGGPCSSNGGSSGANNAAGGGCGCGKQQRQRVDDTRSSRGEYVLHGVLVHDGFSANSGHYYSYVRDGVQHGHWHRMDDSQVSAHQMLQPVPCSTLQAMQACCYQTAAVCYRLRQVLFLWGAAC